MEENANIVKERIFYKQQISKCKAGFQRKILSFQFNSEIRDCQELFYKLYKGRSFIMVQRDKKVLVN